MKLTRLETLIIYNALHERKIKEPKTNDVKNEMYESLLVKIDQLIQLGKDVQIVDRIWE